MTALPSGRLFPRPAVSFQNAGYLSADDVTENNTEDFSDDTDGINPVIFDSDGGIIDAIIRLRGKR